MQSKTFQIIQNLRLRKIADQNPNLRNFENSFSSYRTSIREN